MIAKGNLHAHGGRLAVYMMKGKEDEKTELVEMRGFLSDDLRQAFRTIQAIAESQTQCEKPFFHAYVRLADDERLDHRDWFTVADRIETELGFHGQPRAIAYHVGAEGERHLHIAWSRIDTDEMRAIDPGLYKNKMTGLSRELEVEYGLRRLGNTRDATRQTKAPGRGEFEEARRLGVDVDAVRETIRDCYDRSDNGPSFVAALAEHDLTLARGDRRPFVVVDREGGLHALGARICGVPARDVRERIGEDFAHELPHLAEARAMMKERARAVRDQRRQHAMSETVTDDTLKRQAERATEELAKAQAIREKLAAFEAGKHAEAETARRNEPQRQREDERRRAQGGENSAESRYADALGRHYDVRDPYGSLAKAAMAEYGQFVRQRADLQRRAENERDPARRVELELRIKIEACDYMALTSERLAGISASIAGREDSPIAKRDRGHAAVWREHATLLREERQQLAERQRGNQANQERQQTREASFTRSAEQTAAAGRDSAERRGAEASPSRPNEAAAGRGAETGSRRSFGEARDASIGGRGAEPDIWRGAPGPGRGGGRGGGRGR